MVNNAACSSPGCLSFMFNVPRCVVLSFVSSALFAPRFFATRPGQKSPTAQHDESSSEKDKEEGINYTTVDWREFMCNTWHLEPTLRSVGRFRTTCWPPLLELYLLSACQSSILAHMMYVWLQLSFLSPAPSPHQSIGRVSQFEPGPARGFFLLKGVILPLLAVFRFRLSGSV